MNFVANNVTYTIDRFELVPPQMVVDVVRIYLTPPEGTVPTKYIDVQSLDSIVTIPEDPEE